MSVTVTLSVEEQDACFLSAYNKLSEYDKALIDAQAKKLVKRIKNMGIVSARELLAKIGMKLIEEGGNQKSISV
jgi:hypothetical protein